MLVLGRNTDESIIIDNNIEVMIVNVSKRGKPEVRLGIIAPKEISVHRKEVQDAIDNQRKEALV